MDRSVAEGNSAFHQNSPSPTQPENPGIYGPGSISGSHFSYQHVNDLGLTLSPGSQQLQPPDIESDPFLEDVDELSNNPSLWEIADLPEPHDCMVFQTSLNEVDNHVSSKRSIDKALDGEQDAFSSSPKRRFLASQTEPNSNPSGERPTLSNNDFQGVEHSASSLAANAQREETPDSLFDEPTSLTSRVDEDLLDKPLENAFNKIVDVGPTEIAPVSENTRQRFSLRAEDLETAKTRDIFQGFGKPPAYLSPYPYPLHNSALGYLPSTPNMHLKCIQVTSDKVYEQLLNSRRKVQTVTNERNRYLNLWKTWNTVDPVTGKSREQLIKEENRCLQRQFDSQARQIAELRQEAESWKAYYSSLSTTYNNLLYDIYIRSQAGAQENLPPVAPPPQRLQSQRPGSPTRGSVPVLGPQIPARQGGEQLQAATTVANGSRSNSRAPENPSVTPASMPTPVTIDLTSDESDAAPHSRYTSPHSLAGGETGGQLLQSFRNKKYNWLGDRNHMKDGFRPQPGYAAGWNLRSRRSSSSSQPSSMGSGTYSRPSTADSVPPVQQRTSQADVSDNHPKVTTDQSTIPHEEDDEAGMDDDELARLLEEELAGQ